MAETVHTTGAIMNMSMRMTGSPAGNRTLIQSSFAKKSSQTMHAADIQVAGRGRTESAPATNAHEGLLVSDPAGSGSKK